MQMKLNETHTHIHTHVCFGLPTGAAVMSFHPDVTVVLGHAGLRVQEWQADAAFSTQASIVAVALLNGVLVELVTQSAGQKTLSAEVSDTGRCG